MRQFNSCYHLMYSHIATLKNRQTISKWTTLNYLWAIFVCAEFRKKLDEKVRLFIEEKASFPLTDTKKKQNLQLNMRNLTWQNNGNFDGKCLCLFTCGIPEKSHGTKEVFVFPYFFINFKRRIFLQEGDDLPEIIKTKDQTNEFFRSFYQNYFQGNVFV